jgi:hypothetical protein
VADWWLRITGAAAALAKPAATIVNVKMRGTRFIVGNLG